MESPPPGRLYRFLRWSERYTRTDMVYLTQSGFWLMGEQVVAAILALATATAFGHYVSQDTYGNYKYVLTLASLFAAFSLSGIGTAVTQATSRGFEGSLKQGYSLSMKWSWGIALLACAAAAYYLFYSHNLFLGASMAIVALFSPFLNSYSLFSSFLVGKKDFKRQAIYTTVNALLPALLVIACIWFSDRAIIFVCVYFIGNVISDALFYRMTLRHAANNDRDPHLLSYSKHLSVMGIINVIADKIDSILVFTLLGPARLAIYAYAIAVPEQIKGLSKNIQTLAMPRFAQRSISEIRSTIWRRTLVLTLGLTAGCLIYILLAPFIFSALFPIYASSVFYSQLYVLSIPFTVLALPILSTLQAHKKTRELYIITNVGSIILLITLPVLTFFYGILGAILSQLLYRASGMVMTIWEFSRMRD